MNGISILIKGTLSATRRYKEKLAVYKSEEGLRQNPALISDFQAPEL